MLTEAQKAHALDDLKKLNGDHPYNVGSNIVRDDGYFAASLERSYGMSIKELEVASGYKTSANLITVVNDLDYVLGRAKKGTVNEDDILYLNNCISRIRGLAGPSGEEGEIVKAFLSASEAARQAQEHVAEHFWPLVKAAKTEAEARAILNRVPSCVEKAFFIDHFVFVSNVIPRNQTK